MKVTSLTRWKGNPTEAIPAAKAARSFFERAGAEYVSLSIIHTGKHAGQLFVILRYPDWETYAKSLQAMASDPEFARAYADALRVVELQERTLIVDTDA